MKLFTSTFGIPVELLTIPMLSEPSKYEVASFWRYEPVSELDWFSTKRATRQWDIPLPCTFYKFIFYRLIPIPQLKAESSSDPIWLYGYLGLEIKVIEIMKKIFEPQLQMWMKYLELIPAVRPESGMKKNYLTPDSYCKNALGMKWPSSKYWMQNLSMI